MIDRPKKTLLVWLMIWRFSSLAAAQQIPSGQVSAPVTTFKVESSLVLLDVFALNEKTGLPENTLTKEDFRVFDDGHDMSIRSFDTGASFSTRPIALWLIVQCNLGFPQEWTSTFMRGKTKLLRSALTHLDKNDVVGVAEWCDDGKASIAMQPDQRSDMALAKVDKIIAQKARSGNNRSGELAMQQMIRMVLRDTRHTIPARLPVFLFLYGDHSATFESDANNILEDLLESSGIVFGMNDAGYNIDPNSIFSNGKIFFLAHYYSIETGGLYYAIKNNQQFSIALDSILLQLHFRYTLGFVSEKIDGKRHTLKVELTEAAKKKYKKLRLRYREEYIPTLQEPDWVR